MFVFFAQIVGCMLHVIGTMAPLGALNHLLYAMEDATQASTSTGEIASGRLQQGRRLPTRGENFSSYSELGSLLGRTHVHSAVHDTLLDAYAALKSSHPRHRFVYAETGWPKGGSFAPHHTHQNGLSVDFVVPVVKRPSHGEDPPPPSSLYCGLWNMWCYGVTFDAEGHTATHAIDFEALGAHLIALDDAARTHGTRIERVILAPDLRAHLLATSHGAAIEKRLQFLQGKAWVRHDDHYHVDFAKP